ncbi:MAG: hypothetical protein K0V04_36590 [Deltaproteobacteria bacterium]|nr:hypothetical protein [Deltaproteobacteria bacterium]
MKRFWLFSGLLGLAGGLALACGEEPTSTDGCVGGQQVACACPGGDSGVQVCDASGSFFGPCQCGDATGGGGETEGDTDVVTGGESNTAGDETAGQCGNGIEDPFECEVGDPAYCPDDCMSDTADDTTGSPDSCTSQPTFVAMVPPQPSRWVSGALVGFAAGQDLCRQTATNLGVPDPMEVTVCTYAQVVQAENAGELAAVPAGTTAWLHRLTVADIAGVPTAPGVGGRCQDWVYETNHIADGEHVDFAAGGAATYNLDADTFFDGVDTTHTQPGVLECGSMSRSIMCCNPVCELTG